MGPRSVERGKRYTLARPAIYVQASMGPGSVERGKRRDLSRMVGVVQASMGPRSVERGKVSVSLTNAPDEMLQWGRVLLNAESGLFQDCHAGVGCFNGAAFC